MRTFSGRGKLYGLICIAVALLALAGCRGHVNVYRVSDTPSAKLAGAQGIYYSLPRTMLVVKVPVSKTEYSAGKFIKFALDFFPYLRAKQLIPEDKAATFGVSAATIENRPIGDAENVYLVKLNTGNPLAFWHWFDTHSFDIALNPEGTPSKIVAEAGNEGVAFAVQAVKSASAIFGQILSGGIAAESAPGAQALFMTNEDWDCQVPLTTDELRRINQFTSNDVQERYCNADHKGRTIIGVFGDDPDYLEPFISHFDAINGPDNDELQTFYRAGLEFKEIKTLAKERVLFFQNNSQVKNIADRDGAVKSLDARIAALMKDFTGSSSTTDVAWSGTFNLVPRGQAGSAFNAFGPLDRSPLTLFRLSDTGVCDIAEGTTPGYFVVVPDEITTSKCGTKTTDVSIAMKFDDSQPAKRVATAQRGTPMASKEPNGLYYRIPATAIFMVQQTSGEPKTLATKDFQIAQFGPITALPTTTGGANTKYTLESVAETGAIKNIIVSRTSLIDPSTLADLSKATTDAIAARQTADKAKSDAATSAEAAKKKSNILQQLLDKCVADPTQDFCIGLIK